MIAPRVAATAPVTVPLATITSRRCRSVAPTAASIPNWRRRRWATTTKLAAATNETRNNATADTTSTLIGREHVLGEIPSRGDVAPRVTGRTKRHDTFLGSVDEHQHGVRRRDEGRNQERELVVEIARVLDKADDDPVDSVEGERAADVEGERLGHPVGHGDLVDGHREASVAQFQHRSRRRGPAGPASGSRPSRWSPGPVPNDGRSHRSHQTIPRPPRAWSAMPPALARRT